MFYRVTCTLMDNVDISEDCILGPKEIQFIVDKFQSGKDFLLNGKIINKDMIKEIKVFETQSNDLQESDNVNESFVKDVTKDFIKGV